MTSFFHPVALKLAKIQLLGAWRHFFIFVICLVLAVSATTTISLFSKQIEGTLRVESKSLLGGDLEVTTRKVASTELINKLAEYGKISFVSTTQAMLRAVNPANQQKRLLVSIKAIDKSYPLFGHLKLKSGKNAQLVLNENSVVVDPILLAQLNLTIGSKIQLGNGKYKIVGEIEQEPDRVVQALKFGPRVMMSHQAFKKTKIVTNLSLISYRYRIKLNKPFKQNSDFMGVLETKLNKQFPNLNLSVNNQNHRNNTVARFIAKLTSFLNLLGLGIFLIAGIGIASSIRAYLAKTYQSIAILKVQGARESIIMQTYALIIGVLALISALIGIILAFVIFYSFLPVVSSYIPILNNQVIFDFISPLFALWYALLTAYLFSIPSLLNLHKIKTSSFFRQKIYSFNAPMDKQSWFWITFIGLILVLSISLNSSNQIFMLVSILLIIAALFVFILLAHLARILAGKIQAKSLWLKLALTNISDNKSNIYIVILAIGMSLSILLILNLTQANFNKQIERRLQTLVPDFFMIDIQPNQKNKLEKLLNISEVKQLTIYPLIRGKISHIKGVAIKNLKIPEKINWAFERNRWISYSKVPPKNSQIILGSWWNKDYKGKPLISVDQRLLTEMNLKIGDEITIKILNQSIVAKISSARAIDYTSFQINFFLMLSPNAIRKFPHNFIATVSLNKSNNKDDEIKKRAEIVNLINDNFGNISIVQTKKVIHLIQKVIISVATALKIMASLSIFAGFLILSSVLSANIQDRFYETAIFKVLGASWKNIIKVHLTEWFILSSITCVVAILVGVFGAYLLDTYFNRTIGNLSGSSFYIDPTVIVSLTLITFVLVFLIGYSGLRKIFKIRISNLLRND